MIRLLALVLSLLLVPVLLAQADDVRVETVKFPPGASGTTLSGTIKGRDYVVYKLGARAGQFMTVSLSSGNEATYFNVYAPGKGPGDEALAVGDLTGEFMKDINRFEGVLPQDGEYSISVYLYRSAARRGEVSDYALDVTIGAGGGGDATVPGTEFNATGPLPCARYSGQPMGQCQFGVIRQGNGNGNVTVFWPDGGSRVIFFENGKPAYFDQSQADGDKQMTFERESDLTIIRIGDERFEIVDAILFGG